MGRTRLRKPQESAIFGMLQVCKPARANPRCFHASVFPTSLGLIGRPHGARDCYDDCQERLCDGGPPAEPATNWEDRARGMTGAAGGRSLRSSLPL
jgi:hypothetical protein